MLMDSLPLTPSPVPTPFGESFGSYSCGAASVSPSAQNFHRETEKETVSAQPVKPKQSKSRNGGCITCKAKRLKCDETKPTCRQCAKRGVLCGGYKKDFKWRPFEETSVASRVGKSAKRAPKKKPSPRSTPSMLGKSPSPQLLDDPDYDSVAVPSPAWCPPDIVVVPAESYLPTPPHTSVALDFGDQPYDFDYGQFSENASIASSIASPRLDNFLSPDSENDLGPHFFKSPSPDADNYGPHDVVSPTLTDIDINEDFEDFIGGNQHDWQLFPATSYSLVSQPHGDEFISLFDMFRRPAVTMDSSEMIISHFDKNTCGIMSLKDGPAENPWRTLIWPMAQNTPALWHAILAMSAFHMSLERPQIRMEGMEHMRKSVRFLARGLSLGDIDENAALATTLVLSFSEAFDRHIATGIEHLRGAKILINQALAKSNTVTDPSWMPQFRFLYNVWVYLNVLTHLTSDAEDDIQTPSLYGPFPYNSEVDPLLGCAMTLFPLIGRAASIGQVVRNSTKIPISLISEASQLQVELENWAPEEYYEPIKDNSNDVLHCIQTAQAYRWATLLYLHQAVPELPSLKAHDLAEKVMGLLAGIPITSRSCIVHIFPLLAAGCEAVGEERNWIRSRWEGMSDRMRVGNVDKAWEVTQEVWERRDSFNAEHQGSHKHRERSLSTRNSRFSPPLYLTAVDHELRGWESVPMGSPTQRSLGSGCSDCRHKRASSMGSNASMDYVHEHEFSLRGRLHWAGVMRDKNWEVLLG